MRALVYDEYTTNDDFSKILKIKNLPNPEPRSNEVVFKVISAALNYDDIWGMRGKPLAIPLPHISGTDAAGIVTSVGNDVKNIKDVFKSFNLKLNIINAEHLYFWNFCNRPII